MRILLGLYLAADGLVMVGGTNVNQIRPEDMRKNFGVVHQNVSLFSGTVRDNITLGVDEFDDDVLVKVSEISGVMDWLGKLPNGFDYKLSCWQNIFNHYNFTIPNGFNRQGDTLSANEMWTMTWLDNTHWKNNRYWPQEIDYPISKGTPLLKDLYKQTTHLWNMIDFDKFWFYEDDQVELGGLAEWVLLSEKDNWGMEHDPAHPSEHSHEKFSNKVVKEWIDA